MGIRDPQTKLRFYKRLFARDGYRCIYCGKDVVRVADPFARLPPNAATIDHIIPRSRGGSNHISNLAIACYACNNERADGDAAEFLMRKAARQNEKEQASV